MQISEDLIRDTIDEYVQGTELFLVDLKIGGDRRIAVYLGGDNGVTIRDCELLNRHMNKVLDNDANEFELVVSTAGVGEPLKVNRQYRANLGRKVKVKVKEGKAIEGELTEADEEGIVVKTRKKERIEGRKSKQWVEESHRLLFDDILETKVLVTF